MTPAEVDAAPPDAAAGLVVIGASLRVSEAIDLTLVASAFAPGLSVLMLEPAASECVEAAWQRLALHGVAAVYVPDDSRAALEPPSAPSIEPLSAAQVAALLDGASGILSL